MLNERHIEKFSELYRKRFGKDIDRTEAAQGLQNLVRLLDIISEPRSKENRISENENKKP